MMATQTIRPTVARPRQMVYCLKGISKIWKWSMTHEKIIWAQTMMAVAVPAPSLGIERMVMITKMAPMTPPVQAHQGAAAMSLGRLAGGRPSTSMSQ